MYKITRVGDIATHGAKVITGKSDKLTNDRKTSVVGDLVSCPKHGINKIIAACATIVIGEDRKTAHVVSLTACGAKIITGSTNVIIDRPAGDASTTSLIGGNSSGS